MSTKMHGEFVCPCGKGLWKNLWIVWKSSVFQGLRRGFSRTDLPFSVDNFPNIQQSSVNNSCYGNIIAIRFSRAFSLKMLKKMKTGALCSLRSLSIRRKICEKPTKPPTVSTAHRGEYWIYPFIYRLSLIHI